MAFALVAPYCASAAAQDPLPIDDPADAPSSSYNGNDFTRPQQSISTREEYRTTDNGKTFSERAREMLQLSTKFDLSTDWKLGTLLQVPFIEKRTTPFDGSEAQTGRGLSDVVFQNALLRRVDDHWAFGFGLRVSAPTGSGETGSGTWQLIPAAGFRYSFTDIGPDTYVVPVVRYAISASGDPMARKVREVQIAPTFNIGLPDRWFVTLYPSNDIRINFGPPVTGQTGRLFFPIDAAIGRKLSDGVIASLEGSIPIVKDYPVYSFKTELKLTWQF